jgi:glyoxylase-like metal-dependent hydrolase (beta-lactamase superfamily II)
MVNSPYLTVELTESVTQVTPNIWLLTGFPNVVFVVGNTATLVVDTGLGLDNGALVARVAANLSRSSKLLLTTTHFHPEHAAGVGGFPAETVLVMPRMQQEELDDLGPSVLATFKDMAQFASATPGIESLRPPDVVFDRHLRLDLGGVEVRLIFLGAAHTRGDELIYVEPDRALISGDVVQKHVVPFAASPGASYASWLEVLRRLRPLRPRTVVPTHSPVGDGSLIDAEIAFITDMRDRAASSKAAGCSADDVASRLLLTLEDAYPDWADNQHWPNRATFDRFVSGLYLEIPALGEDQEAQISDSHESHPETSGCCCSEALAALCGSAQV